MDRRTALRRAGFLAGAALTTPTLVGLLQSCGADTAAGLDWTPTFLSGEEARFLSSFLDTLLPRTDTPGALDVGVDRFLDKVYTELYDEKGKAFIQEQFAALNAEAKAAYGDDFADLSNDDRLAFLRQKEADSPTFNPSVWGSVVGKQEPVGFYRQLKSSALWGYVTSEEVGTEVLTYLPVPGPYRGCIPFEEVGRRYSL